MNRKAFFALSAIYGRSYLSNEINAITPSREDFNLVRFDPNNLLHLAQELGLKRLRRLEPYLSVTGRPVPPVPLHRHVLLGRRFLVTEQMDLHLVWSTDPLDILLKLLPYYLLMNDFWERYLLCECEDVKRSYLSENVVNASMRCER